jgi:cobalt-precorrin 5A hydrolase
VILFPRGIAIVYATAEDKAKELFDKLKHKGYTVSLFNYKEVEKAWKCYDAIIFVMALGGVVRTVCKYARSKDVDPSVICVDDGFRFVIPVLSSHWGANDLTLEVSKIINATPVITTASEIKGITSIEELARILNCKIVNVKAIVRVTSALLKGEKVCVKGVEKIPEGVKGNYVIGDECEYKVVITDSPPIGDDGNTVYLKPIKFVIGVGSKKETNKEVIKEAIFNALNLISASMDRVVIIASVREKVKEVADELKVPFRLISWEEINAFNDECLTPPSDKLKELGIKGVAEVSALIAGKGRLILRKIRYKGEVTVAIASYEGG